MKRKKITEHDIITIIEKLKYNGNFLTSLQSLSNKDYQTIIEYFYYVKLEENK